MRLRLIVMAALVWLAGCAAPPTPVDPEAARASLTATVIQPAYADFAAAAVDFQATVTAFVAAPVPAALDELRAAWVTLALAWESVAAYAPDDAIYDVLYALAVPVDVALLEAQMNAGAGPVAGAEGLYALEYLLFDQDVSLTVDAFGGPRRAAYLQTAAQTIAAQANAIMRDAQQRRITEEGLRASLARHLAYNADVRLAGPAGLGETMRVRPETLLTYRSGIGLQQIRASLEATQAALSGGLYVLFADPAQGNRTNARLQTAIRAADALQGPLSQAILNDAAGVRSLLDALWALSAALLA